jgi:hypothetical protein
VTNTLVRIWAIPSAFLGSTLVHFWAIPWCISGQYLVHFWASHISERNYLKGDYLKGTELKRHRRLRRSLTPLSFFNSGREASQQGNAAKPSTGTPKRKLRFLLKQSSARRCPCTKRIQKQRFSPRFCIKTGTSTLKNRAFLHVLGPFLGVPGVAGPLPY